ncbi:MAG: endonuclease/exonuclease/phosphatase family protein [Burkholderiales bacterium]|nr:endonuclease/exonuclease/phosphatase family protein [Burkholderiales bacterium]
MTAEPFAWRDFVLRRARILALLCAAGLLLPVACALLPAQSGGTLAWLIDLACHWQWLYAAGLVACTLVTALAFRWWLLLLPLAALPWFSAAPRLAAAEPGTPDLVVASANVQWQTGDVRPLARWLADEAPDVVVVIEVSPAFAQELARLAAYPHRHLVPREDPFGIALLSRHPLLAAATVRDADGLPHIEARIAWQGRVVSVRAAHPMPPLAAEHHLARNAKLAHWARAAAAARLPAIVAGDLNATPWSTAFNELDGLGLRRTTGLAPTWPAALGGVVGIPIDHVLASPHWRLVAGGVGPDLGSDHLPVLARLRLTLPAPAVP